MNKIPIQIYFDPDTAAFYKGYAASMGKSFAEVIRTIAQEKKREIVASKNFKKMVKKKQFKHPMLQALDEVTKKLKDSHYYYPDKSDDELIYG